MSRTRGRSPEAKKRRGPSVRRVLDAAKRADERVAAAMEGVAEAALIEARSEERPDLCRRCYKRPHVPLHDLCRACRYYTRDKS